MEHDFGVPVAAVQWISLVYLLGLVAMLAPAGRLGDAAGRQLVHTYWPGISVARVIRPAIPGTLGRNRHGPRSACLPPLSRQRP
jgi:MFS family permease